MPGRVFIVGPGHTALVWLDHAKLKVAREVRPGDEFGYVLSHTPVLRRARGMAIRIAMRWVDSSDRRNTIVFCVDRRFEWLVVGGVFVGIGM